MFYLHFVPNISTRASVPPRLPAARRDSEAAPVAGHDSDVAPARWRSGGGLVSGCASHGSCVSTVLPSPEACRDV